MERKTRRLLEEAFNVELYQRYDIVIESVARDLAGMLEVLGLHSSDEVFGCFNGAAAVISVVFGEPDARPDIARIVDEIASSDAYREL